MFGVTPPNRHSDRARESVIHPRAAGYCCQHEAANSICADYARLHQANFVGGIKGIGLEVWDSLPVKSVRINIIRDALTEKRSETGLPEDASRGSKYLSSLPGEPYWTCPPRWFSSSLHVLSRAAWNRISVQRKETYSYSPRVPCTSY